MKKKRTLLLVLLFAAGQVIAQQQTNTSSAPFVSSASVTRTNAPAAVNVVASKPKIHLFGPAKPVEPQKQLRLIEGLDPRAWTTVAETRTSESAFPSGVTQKPRLYLLWWGAEPQMQR